ncbi:hypothetical protein IAU60_006906 [Kwoniella sp. DSM 27419]
MGRKEQTIILLGISGSGKTHNSCLLVDKLAPASQRPADLAIKLAAVHKILSAFGNASTMNNPDSSRFVKITKFSYEAETSRYIGTAVETKFLELSRLIPITLLRTPYNVFDMSRSLRQPSTFRVLHQLARSQAFWPTALFGPSSAVSAEVFCLTSADDHSSDDISGTLEALKCFCNADERANVIKTLLAILYLGNIRPRDLHRNDANMLRYVKTASVLIGQDFDLLLTTLTKRVIARDVQPKSEADTGATLGCLLKDVYRGLWQWLEMKINCGLAAVQSVKDVASIDLVDVFGMEDLNVDTSPTEHSSRTIRNSLEQLGVNLTHAHFMAIVGTFPPSDVRQIIDSLRQHEGNQIKNRLRELVDHGVIDRDVDFTSKREPLDCLTMVSEKINHATNSRLPVEKLHDMIKSVNPSGSRAFPMTDLQHHIGSVTYDLSGMTEKNLHKSFIEVTVLLQSCTLKSIVTYGNTSVKVSSRRPLLEANNADVLKIKAKLTAAEHHAYWIMCLRPWSSQNDGFGAGWNPQFFQAQLASCGVEILSASGVAGWSRGFDVDDLIGRYSELLEDSVHKDKDRSRVIHAIMRAARVDLRSFHVNCEKVFIKQDVTEKLETAKGELREAVASDAVNAHVENGLSDMSLTPTFGSELILEHTTPVKRRPLPSPYMTPGVFGDLVHLKKRAKLSPHFTTSSDGSSGDEEESLYEDDTRAFALRAETARAQDGHEDIQDRQRIIEDQKRQIEELSSENEALHLQMASIQETLRHSQADNGRLRMHREDFAKRYWDALFTLIRSFKIDTVKGEATPSVNEIIDLCSHLDSTIVPSLQSAFEERLLAKRNKGECRSTLTCLAAINHLCGPDKLVCDLEWPTRIHKLVVMNMSDHLYEQITTILFPEALPDESQARVRRRVKEVAGLFRYMTEWARRLDQQDCIRDVCCKLAETVGSRLESDKRSHVQWKAFARHSVEVIDSGFLSVPPRTYSDVGLPVAWWNEVQIDQRPPAIYASLRDSVL